MIAYLREANAVREREALVCSAHSELGEGASEGTVRVYLDTTRNLSEQGLAITSYLSEKGLDTTSNLPEMPPTNTSSGRLVILRGHPR